MIRYLMLLDPGSADVQRFGPYRSDAQRQAAVRQLRRLYPNSGLQAFDLDIRKGVPHMAWTDASED